MAAAALARLCLAACLAAATSTPALIGQEKDVNNLLQTEVGVDRVSLDLSKSHDKRRQAKHHEGPAEPDAQKDAETESGSDAVAVAERRNASTIASDESAAASSEATAPSAQDETQQGWCGYEAQSGFLTTYTKPGSDSLLLDLTEAFQRSSTIRFVVTAMTVSGTYSDEGGYLTEYANPMEETADTMFEFRLGRDNISVDVFRPQLDLRTSDGESLAALRRGTGNGHMETLGTYQCGRRSSASDFMFKSPSARADNVVNLNQHDGPLAESLLHDRGTAQEAFGAKSWEANVPVLSLVTAAAPVAEAENRTIISGSSLIRSGFFVAPSVKMSTTYRLLSVKVFERNIDVTVEYMQSGSPVTIGFSMVRLPDQPMRPRPADDRILYFKTDYQDLGEHGQYRDERPSESVDRKVSTIWRYNLAGLGGQIRIHIDPTVPTRWRKWFKDGVEAWNEAFALIGKPNAVRAVLPTDDDWPKDYDVSDARFSTISWTISREVVSAGIAKVDPRSGEILKSDIFMSDGWVRAWLGDLDLLAPNFTHQLQESTGFRVEAHGDAPIMLGRRRVPGRLHPREEDFGKKISLLSMVRGQPMGPGERDEVLGKGLQNVVTHETGHILGLRHNFKGSLGVTYACIRSASCSAVNGLTASVMDYIPVNLPTADEPDVHLFTPVLGGYDKLAIRYGYMEVDRSSSLDSELEGVLQKAEMYDTCYDDDRIAGQDPSCMAYDISSDPLQAYEDEMKRLAAVQSHLLNTSVMPGAPYTHYGESVNQVLLLARSIGMKLVGWLGGVQNSYVNRRMDGSHPVKVARRPLRREVQRRALGLLLQLMRPAEAGLLPPTESLPFLVAATEGDGSVESLDLDLRVRSIARTLMSDALAPKQLMRVYEQEKLQSAQDPSSFLSTGEFLARFVKGVVGEGFATTSPSEWDLQRLLVNGLAQLLGQDKKLPGEVRAHVAHHMLKLRSRVEVALAQLELGESPVESEEPREQELLQAHLASLHQDLTAGICGDGTTRSCPGLGSSGAAPTTRMGVGLWMFAFALALIVPAP